MDKQVQIHQPRQAVNVSMSKFKYNLHKVTSFEIFILSQCEIILTPISGQLMTEIRFILASQVDPINLCDHVFLFQYIFINLNNVIPVQGVVYQFSLSAVESSARAPRKDNRILKIAFTFLHINFIHVSQSLYPKIFDDL